ncbi:hypothetical protein ABE61_18670 [Lysinibacillus sphaericus]|uniref:hypothetical protein n=1 Tax=Lysinibacillus sphaericus TaxID=1421 RepID=UPI0018CE46FA|nr:hypothetical protein [Lysinibacillus sphaericus]MBG9456003.1 hypothetical protein [Lysinibacillus sphaericus]MBG9479648.1 hypothetical protein [Lysinibacillus sphaericus]MBG9593870.1 hypothetical protein [Lysinibacillus sphaericus]
MNLLIYLYPKSWRKRYGDEILDLLEQKDWTFFMTIDLLRGIVDAWKIEINEREILGIRMSNVLLLVGLINLFIILQYRSSQEVIIMEQITLIIAIVSFFLAVSIFIVHLFKEGLQKAFSISTKLSKMSLGFMGIYGLSIITFLVLAN